LNETVIPQFTQYPLLSSKKITFDTWVKCIQLINSGEHKNDKGLYKLLSLYASIGRGLSKKVLEDFPLLIPAVKPVYIKPNSALSEFWLSGYFCMYCNFKVDVNPHGLKESYYNRVVPSFNFSRNIEELALMESIGSYFNVTPNIRSNKLRVDINVYGIDKATVIID
jgi:hypothetical protein